MRGCCCDGPTLTDVRDLLAALQEEMALLKQVPEIAAQVQEIYAAVVTQP